jgi:hypothetical protein
VLSADIAVMSKSVVAAVALALCLGFGGGYVARGSMHAGSGAGSPSPTPSIRPAQEFVSMLTFCAHLGGFAAIQRDFSKGRTGDAAKRLKSLSSSILGDANLFDAAHDAATATSLRSRATALMTVDTAAKLAPIEGALEQMCRDLKAAYPAPSR